MSRAASPLDDTRWLGVVDERGRPAASLAAPQRRRRPLMRLARRVLGLAIAGLVLAVLAVGGLWVVTPTVADAPARVAREIRPHGARVMATLPSSDRTAQALLATEDSRFWHTPGVDPISLVRAAVGLIRGHDTGAATLDQQLTKRLYTPASGSWWSKVEDAELAVKLDARFGKSEILRLYLSDVYFGHGYYGLPAAAEGYFGVGPSQLDWGQAAMLAGLVQAPSAYDPATHLALARAREQHVLHRLVAVGALTPGQAAAAFAAPLRLRVGAGAPGAQAG